MALPCFTEWTVLPHKSIEQVDDNLWTVHGTMPRAGVHRTMTIVRRTDGTLLLHNVIALEESEMKALEALSTPMYFVVPNGHHRQDILIFKKRYPQAKVVC